MVFDVLVYGVGDCCQFVDELMTVLMLLVDVVCCKRVNVPTCLRLGIFLAEVSKLGSKRTIFQSDISSNKFWWRSAILRGFRIHKPDQLRRGRECVWTVGGVVGVVSKIPIQHFCIFPCFLASRRTRCKTKKKTNDHKFFHRLNLRVSESFWSLGSEGNSVREELDGDGSDEQVVVSESVPIP